MRGKNNNKLPTAKFTINVTSKRNLRVNMRYVYYKTYVYDIIAVNNK